MYPKISPHIWKHTPFTLSIVCPNCGVQCYVKRPGYRPKHPVLLDCGHSVCEGCAVNGGPRLVTCGTCGLKTNLKVVEHAKLPRNAYVLGIVSLTNSSYPKEDPTQTYMQPPNNSCTVEKTTRLCDECCVRIAVSICHTCNRHYCERCWAKAHSKDSLKTHVPLSVNSSRMRVFGQCPIHPEKPVQFFCRQCNDYICSQCARMTHDGANHEVMTVKDKNVETIQKLQDVQKEVEENIRRMEETIEEVTDIQDSMEQSSSSSDTANDIVQCFIYLHGMLQVAEQSIKQKLKRQEENKRMDLINLVSQLQRQIRSIRLLFDDIRAISESDTLLGAVSMEDLLPVLMRMKYAPCMLPQSNYDRNGKFAFEEAKIHINEEILHELKNYVTVDLPNNQIQLVNTKGQTNADLGFLPRPEREFESRPVPVSRGVIVSGSSKQLKSQSFSIPSSTPSLVKFPIARAHSSIAEGCTYGVFLSYVVDPGEFYIIRTVVRKQQQRIEKLAPAMIERCAPAPRRVKKDELYLVENVLDDKWYRGRVVEVLPTKSPAAEPSILIYNLDYGNTQIAPQSRLRQMPELLQAEPPMAIKCRLADCIPKNGKWSRESTRSMVEIFDEHMLTMYVVRVLPDVLEVDIAQKSRDGPMFDGEVISLRDSMVFMEYASLVAGSHGSEIRKTLPLQYPAFYLPRTDTTFTGIITHVVSSNTMYMQKVCLDTDYLMDVMDRMNDYYDANNQKGYIYNPVVGMPCVAICTQDYMWYRARIIDIPGHERITVQYIDYGNEDTLHYKLVRKIKLDFLRLPPQAFLCTLHDFPDVQERSWKSNPKKYMEQVMEEVFEVTVCTRVNDALIVSLKRDTCCVKTDHITFPPEENKKKNNCPFLRIRPSAIAGSGFSSGALGEIVDQAKLLELFNSCDRTSENQQKRQKRETAQEDDPSTSASSRRDEMLKLEIKVIDITTPGDLYVTVQALVPRLEMLDKELQEFNMFDTARRSIPWAAGNNCCILSYNHGKWLRGFVKEILENGMILVQYFDVVGVEEVPISCLRALDPHFMTYPIGAIKCHLDGISPPERRWPDATTVALLKELQKHDKIYMTKKGKLEDTHSLPIKLWVKDEEEEEEEEEEESAEQPPGVTWINLNESLVDQGLAVSDNPDSLEDSSPEHAVEKRECESDEYEIDENDFKLKNVTEAGLTDLSYRDQPDEFDWIQPPVSTVKYFIGEPTFIDDHCIIYMHDVERDGSTLELLQYTLNQLFKDTEPNFYEPPWSVNEICIARYCIDKSWYRGKILEIRGEMHKVLFVDYGNVEYCQSSSLRRSTTFIKTPALARRYKLYGIKPISDDGHWPAEVIDKIYETIIEKKCNITVVGRDSNGIYSIYLKMCECDQDLAEQLVSSGLAKLDTEMESASNGIPQNFIQIFDQTGNDPVCYFPSPLNPRANSGYRALEFPFADAPFPVKVTVVRDSDLSAVVVDDECLHPGVRASIASLKTLTEQMQRLGQMQPMLLNVVAGVACLCLYSIHQKWYRGEVDRVDSRRDLVVVYYVDHGYKEFVTRDRVRTVLPNWFTIPQMALNFRLHRVRKQQGVKRKTYLSELTECLSQPDLLAHVITKRDDHYEVEIRERDTSELAYQRLIDNGILRLAEDDEVQVNEPIEDEEEDEDDEDEDEDEEDEGRYDRGH